MLILLQILTCFIKFNFILKAFAFAKNLFFPLSMKTAVKVRAITKIKET